MIPISAFSRILLSVCALLASTLARADSFAITHAELFGPGGVAHDVSILVQDQRISAVGSKLALLAGIRQIDAAGRFVTSGFFAPLSNLGVNEISLVEETNDQTGDNRRYSAAFDMVDSFNPYSSLIPVARVDGVTRAVVAPLANHTLLAGAGMVISTGSLKNWLVQSKVAMFGQLGETGVKLVGGRADAWLNLQEMFLEVKQASERSAPTRHAASGTGAQTGAKAGAKPGNPLNVANAASAATAANVSPVPNLPSLLTQADIEALRPVLQGRMPLVLSLQRASDILAAIKLARQYGIALVIHGAAEGWMVADELARNKVPVIINPEQNLPERFESLFARNDNAAMLQRAGVLVAFSFGAARAHNVRNLRQLAARAVAYGMEPGAALAAITLNPAKIYGMDKQMGSVEPGKLADLVLWDGNPLEALSYPSQVWIGGAAVPNHTRQTELRDRYLQRLQLAPIKQ
jgi:imidazolonepropionase-like amidohydrolase